MQIPRNIPTLTEVFPKLLNDQIMKQQTSLLTAILELHKTIQTFQSNPDLQLRVKELEEELNQAELHNKELEDEVEALAQIIDAAEVKTAKYEKAELEAREIEKNFQENRFQTLQGYYKSSTERAKQLQDEVNTLKAEIAKTTKAPAGYKSWEDAAMVERLQHNATKTALDHVKQELIVAKSKVDKFERLFKEALE
jgi:chromosome segregation ATPase